MSHGDRVTRLPPGFRVGRRRARARRSPRSPTMRGGSTACCSIPRWCTRRTAPQLLRNFTHGVLGLSGTWTMAGFRATEIARIRAQVGHGRVICGLSGGVDSSVAAVLIHEAIGDQLTCIFVDHGLLRQGEAEEVVAHVPRPVQHPTGASRRVGPVPRCAGRRHRSGGEAQDDRPAVHRRVRGGGARSSAAPIFWRRARCIRT